MRARDRSTLIAITVAVVITAVFLAGGFAYSRATQKTVSFRVTRTQDQPTSHCTDHGCKTTHKYLVFTDHGTYQDTDAFWFFKFNSSDLIGQLRDGHRYRCDTTGFRLALGSHYRNLLHCKEQT